MTMNTLQTGASKVNLTTDLRNVIHQINPNDLLCAYKPTFEKWATRTLQDIEPPTEEDSGKVFTGTPMCAHDVGQGDDKASTGWELCPLPHSGAATTYQRELTSNLKIHSNKRTQSTSTVDKQESRLSSSTTEKPKVSSGLYPGRSTFHDYRIKDFGEERGYSSSYNRSHSPRHVPFKHSECNGQHMDNYRETYTYRKIGTHKNQYMKRALASGLTLQHYPFRCSCDNHCCQTGYTRSGLTSQKDASLTTMSSSVIKPPSRSPQLQADVLVTERRRVLRVANGNRLGMAAVSRKERTSSPVPRGLTGLNSGVMNVEAYNQNMASSSTTRRELSNVLLDVPLMVCRTHPPLHNKSPEKMYQLTPPNGHVMPSLIGSDSPSEKKK